MASSNELSFREFSNLLRRRKREIFLWWGATFLCVAIYTFVTPPVYQAQVEIKVQMPEDMSRSVEIGPVNIMGVAANAFNQDMMSSPQIVTDALRMLGKITPSTTDAQQKEMVNDFIRRSRVGWREKDSQTVLLTMTSLHRKDVAPEANAWAEIAVKQVGIDLAAKTHQGKMFIENQLHEVEGRLRDSEERLRRFQEKAGPTSASNFLITRLMELKSHRTTLLQKFTPSHPEIQQINGEIDSIEQQLQRLPNQEIDMTRITREIHLNEELFTMLTKRSEDAQIMESARLVPLTIIEPAIEPARPERPNKPFNLAAGFALGLLIASGVVWIRHQLDTSLLTIQDIEAILQLPVLAMVPHIERRVDKPGMGPMLRKVEHLGKTRSRLILHFRQQSPVVEVYHILRTNLPKWEFEGRGRVLAFTSAVVGEGKSTTAVNFAIAAAQSGVPTLLVEADLRKPSVDKLFGINSEPGITDYFYLSPRWENYLTGWQSMIQQNPELSQAVNTEGLSNLYILPSGKIPSNPVALLSSERMITLLNDMRQRFPLIVVDCAPVMLFADCTILSPHVDGVILVYRFGRTDRDALKQSYHNIISAKAKVLGVVVNDVLKGDSTDYTGYYSTYSEAYERLHVKSHSGA